MMRIIVVNGTNYKDDKILANDKNDEVLGWRKKWKVYLKMKLVKNRFADRIP